LEDEGKDGKTKVKRNRHYRLEMPPEFCHLKLQVRDLSEENHTNV